MQEQNNTRQTRWKKLLFSRALYNKNLSHKLAYIAVVTAFVVVANMFFEFKLADTQFSFTLLVSMIAGLIIGPIFGFCACFLGDLVGFLYHSSGFAYMPWIGIAMGMAALISGFVVSGIPLKKKWGLQIKLAIACVLTFCVCTVAINTTAFWLLYAKGVPYFTYFITRIFVQGQIWNSLVNYVLLFLITPTLVKIKPLRIQI